MIAPALAKASCATSVGMMGLRRRDYLALRRVGCGAKAGSGLLLERRVLRVQHCLFPIRRRPANAGAEARSAFHNVAADPGAAALVGHSRL